MTSYDEIYDVFLSNIDDIELLYQREMETDTEYNTRLDNILFSTLKRAIVKYTFSKTKLDRDDEIKQFLYDLRPLEVEILGLLMLREYYRKKLNFLVQLKHSFSDKDWKSHDKSNAMNQYRQLLAETNAEIKILINNNSLMTDSGDLEDWNNE